MVQFLEIKDKVKLTQTIHTKYISVKRNTAFNLLKMYNSNTINVFKLFHYQKVEYNDSFPSVYKSITSIAIILLLSTAYYIKL